jgi:hypothetical protein
MPAERRAQGFSGGKRLPARRVISSMVAHAETAAHSPIAHTAP